jgi:hypothetical protein
MKLKATDFTYRPTKKGMKIEFFINLEEKKKAAPHLYLFEDKPLDVDINIDALAQKEILGQISPEQRRKLFALFKDINELWHYPDINDVKEEMKRFFLLANEQYQNFSLRDCDSTLANDFITYVLAFCYQNGVALKEPRALFDDLDSYLYMCLKFRKCVVCQNKGEEHHVEAIGMGRNRQKYDDSNHLKVCLCREHHSEAHGIGWKTFAEKHHVKGILFTQTGG